ncbi:MAG: SIR2 family protein [Acidimicrobiales bacterium]
MSIEPSLSLASSMHAGPGTFALLLGSGVSVSAEVPTGWQVVENLIRRLAFLQGVDAGNDPIAWYRDRTGDDPDYSQLLTDIARSPAERQTLLSGSFTPTAIDREGGLKIPTKAHHAIAELVAKSYVKVILTTNFDRLLETALSEVDVHPQVISNPAHVAGSTPLTHARCTIIKVHGDYLSPDLKNTVEELAHYDPDMDKLLDEVFDQYGLVIVGWSGVWDPALRGAIRRTPNHRYSTYWARHRALAEEAKDLVAGRGAIEILIDDADTFFDALKEKVLTLADAVDQQLAGTAIAVGQLKRYLPDPIHRIRLHDLVMGQVTALIAEVDQVTGDEAHLSQNYAEALQCYERAAATLNTLIINGAFYGDHADHDQLWFKAMERLASRPQESGRAHAELHHYPVMLALYALGLGALAANRVKPLVDVIRDVKVLDERKHLLPVAEGAASWTVLDSATLKNAIPALGQSLTPISRYLHDLFRPIAAGPLPDDPRYKEIFDVLEYILGVTFARCREDGYGPKGEFVSNDNYRPEHQRTPDRVDRLVPTLLDAGWFDNDQAFFTEVRRKYDAQK